MSGPVHIVDGQGRSHRAQVTSQGQLVTSPIKYDETQFVELAIADSGYTFYLPRAGEQFIITGIRAKADRDVSNTVDADVVIFEAAESSTTTVEKVLHQEAMIRGESVTLIPTNIRVEEGRWVNAKTSDDDIHMTVMGYYIPKLS